MYLKFLQYKDQQEELNPFVPRHRSFREVEVDFCFEWLESLRGFRRHAEEEDMNFKENENRWNLPLFSFQDRFTNLKKNKKNYIYPNEPSIESLQLMFDPEEKEEIFEKWFESSHSFQWAKTARTAELSLFLFASQPPLRLLFAQQRKTALPLAHSPPSLRETKRPLLPPSVSFSPVRKSPQPVASPCAARSPTPLPPFARDNAPAASLSRPTPRKAEPQSGFFFLANLRPRQARFSLPFDVSALSQICLQRPALLRLQGELYPNIIFSSLCFSIDSKNNDALLLNEPSPHCEGNCLGKYKTSFYIDENFLLLVERIKSLQRLEPGLLSVGPGHHYFSALWVVYCMALAMDFEHCFDFLPPGAHNDPLDAPNQHLLAPYLHSLAFPHILLPSPLSGKVPDEVFPFSLPRFPPPLPPDGFQSWCFSLPVLSHRTPPIEFETPTSSSSYPVDRPLALPWKTFFPPRLSSNASTFLAAIPKKPKFEEDFSDLRKNSANSSLPARISTAEIRQKQPTIGPKTCSDTNLIQWLKDLQSDDLVRLWVAEGFVKEMRDSLLEDVGEEYYNELIRRNLLQPDSHFFNAGPISSEKESIFAELCVFLKGNMSFRRNINFTSTKSVIYCYSEEEKQHHEAKMRCFNDKQLFEKKKKKKEEKQKMKQCSKIPKRHYEVREEGRYKLECSEITEGLFRVASLAYHPPSSVSQRTSEELTEV
ncbi:hypothetical protein M5K25_018914 [Dendrobium thyrsiflorum]|uniref:Disease resistance protein winged helix domain-containing protein n=1 Tax=Dendrobium thyrsiflorum TaxID=117978 RepID=A0ABD0UDP0_DENTH